MCLQAGEALALARPGPSFCRRVTANPPVHARVAGSRHAWQPVRVFRGGQEGFPRTTATEKSGGPRTREPSILKAEADPVTAGRRD